MYIFTSMVPGLTLICIVGLVAAAVPKIPTKEKDPRYWNDMARQTIDARLRIKENNSVAKNVILFIGDGLGPTTVTAARILRGQINNQPGEETVLKFEEFPNIALSKTYNLDRQTPDSAGTATAMLSGVKTNWFLIGLDGTAQMDDCEGSKSKHVPSMLNWAQDAGKWTGVVSTARITHATPAAVYAHSANRYWEGVTEVPEGCTDIAKQLIDQNRDINVILGGGRRYFLSNTTADPEYGTIHSKQRTDGRDLTKDWADDKKDRGKQYKYVWNKEQFDNVDPRYNDYILGLFEPGHMQYELDRDTAMEPSLAEMVRKSIQILKKSTAGFFLMVEGARIDHAHHDSKAKKALYETLALEEAIRDAVDLTDADETLIIVTGDHSHVFDIAGYAYRGTDVFGLVEPVDSTEETADDKPYSVLVYANGPGYTEPRTNLTDENLRISRLGLSSILVQTARQLFQAGWLNECDNINPIDTNDDKDYVYPSAVPMPWETHGGEDVAIYAQGPMGHLFHGVHEQNYIAHVMAYSACVGPYHGDCGRPEVTTVNDARKLLVYSQTLYISLLLAVMVIYK